MDSQVSNIDYGGDCCHELECVSSGPNGIEVTLHSHPTPPSQLPPPHPHTFPLFPPPPHLLPTPHIPHLPHLLTAPTPTPPHLHPPPHIKMIIPLISHSPQSLPPPHPHLSFSFFPHSLSFSHLLTSYKSP